MWGGIGTDGNAEGAPLWAGGQVRFDTESLASFGDRIQFRLPAAECGVDAVGTVQSGPYTFWRCHLDRSEGFIEVCLKSGHVVSCSLFMSDMEESPTTEAKWASWMAEGSGQLGAPIISHGDHDYRRLWNPSNRWASPVPMAESVSSREAPGARTIDRKCMLYGRTVLSPLGSGQPEFDELLLRQTDSTRVETYVGMRLSPISFEIIPPPRGETSRPET